MTQRFARLPRRQLLAGGAALAGMAALRAEAQASGPVTIGSGYWTYTLVKGWGAPPPGMTYEWGCAVVVDSRDRVYVHTRAQKAVLVFDRHGRLLTDFGSEFAKTGHGLYHQKVGSDEFLYFADHPRNLVVKTDLNGKVLMRIGQVSEENATNIRFPFDQPTDVAVAPNGDLYVCEGYGGDMVHRFTAEGKFVQTIGIRGSGPGQFRVPHGIWVDTRHEEPEIYVADRANRRIQVFTPHGTLKRIVTDGIRNPCCFYPYRGKMFVPDLDQVVTILDEQDRVVAHLGDGRAGNDPHAFSRPHALTIDSHGDLYVVEWVPDARLRKFRHTPQRT